MSILDKRGQVESRDKLSYREIDHLKGEFADQAPVALEHKRLIVVVPEGISGNMDFAHKIHWLSTQEQRDVLFLALYDNKNSELSTARHLATLEAVTRDVWYSVSSKLVNTANWQDYLRDLCQPDDIIICHAEQSVQIGRFKTMPLSDYLQEAFKLPVKTISGFYQPGKMTLRGWGIKLLFWVGLLMIVAGSTFLEIRADQVVSGFPHPIILMILLLFEMGMIWLWNAVAG